MKDVLTVLTSISKDTLQFYLCLTYFLLQKPFKSCPYFQENLHAKIHIYSLAIAFYLYDKEHYRKDSYREDIVDNFRNVAVPGTGLPLSIFVGNKLFAFVLVVVLYPIISLVASVHWYYLQSKHGKHGDVNVNVNVGLSLMTISEEYSTRLLTPNDWFSYWRLNSRLAAYHSYIHNISPGYHMENKWTFLLEGSKRNVPISPFLHTPSALVIKHKNEEGGMGIHFFKNAVHGGDWIIQERIYNSEWVQSLLPKTAPLSTFRVMTYSRLSVSMEDIEYREDKTSSDEIKALSCVFRAGREGASTDHDSILFDVDIQTGKIQYGTTNAHWYKLYNFTSPWRSTSKEYTSHPDAPIQLKDKTIPNFPQILKLVEDCHYKMCPDVPFVGWDVVLSTNTNVPVCLLEVNLSCNFFRGSFDKEVYLGFCRDLCEGLDERRFEDKKTK